MLWARADGTIDLRTKAFSSAGPRSVSATICTSEGQGVHGALYTSALSNVWKVCRGEFGGPILPSVEMQGPPPSNGRKFSGTKENGGSHLPGIDEV